MRISHFTFFVCILKRTLFVLAILRKQACWGKTLRFSEDVLWFIMCLVGDRVLLAIFSLKRRRFRNILNYSWGILSRLPCSATNAQWCDLVTCNATLVLWGIWISVYLRFQMDWLLWNRSHFRINLVRFYLFCRQFQIRFHRRLILILPRRLIFPLFFSAYFLCRSLLFLDKTRSTRRSRHFSRMISNIILLAWVR